MKRTMICGLMAMMSMLACAKKHPFTESNKDKGYAYDTTERGLTPSFPGDDECVTCPTWWEDPNNIELDRLCEDAVAPAEAVMACSHECDDAPNPGAFEACLDEVCGAQIDVCLGDSGEGGGGNGGAGGGEPECLECAAYVQNPVPEVQEAVCADQQADVAAIAQCRMVQCDEVCTYNPSSCESCLWEMCSAAMENCLY